MATASAVISIFYTEFVRITLFSSWEIYQNNAKIDAKFDRF